MSQKLEYNQLQVKEMCEVALRIPQGICPTSLDKT